MIKVEQDGLTGRDIERSSADGKRLFLRYEITIESSFTTKPDIQHRQVWEALYVFIASLKPIAGHGQLSKRKADGDFLGKQIGEFWIISRVPALPTEMEEYFKEHKLIANVNILSWGWAPAGLKDLSDEDVDILESAFNSNVLMREFLEVEPEE